MIASGTPEGTRKRNEQIDLGLSVGGNFLA